MTGTPHWIVPRPETSDLHSRIMSCIDKHGLSTVMLRRIVEEVGQEVPEVFDGELGGKPPFLVRMLRHFLGDREVFGHRPRRPNGALVHLVFPGIDDFAEAGVREAEKPVEHGFPKLTVNQRLKMRGFVPVSPFNHSGRL